MIVLSDEVLQTAMPGSCSTLDGLDGCASELGRRRVPRDLVALHLHSTSVDLVLDQAQSTYTGRLLIPDLKCMDLCSTPGAQVREAAGRLVMVVDGSECRISIQWPANWAAITELSI